MTLDVQLRRWLPPRLLWATTTISIMVLLLSDLHEVAADSCSSGFQPGDSFEDLGHHGGTRNAAFDHEIPHPGESHVASVLQTVQSR